DVHQISEDNGTEVTNAVLTAAPYNFHSVPVRGGYNYLITVPAGVSSATPQVYNPAFAPDQGYNATPPASNPGNAYNLHEQDGSFTESGDSTFPTGHADKRQYSAMEYTLFKVVNQFD